MPAPATRTIRDVEEEAAGLIEAIEASPFSQGKKAARFRETSVPFTVLQDASNLGHLLFEVWIQDAPNSDLSRGAEYGTDERAVTIAARMKVQFTYKLRAQHKKEDARAATDAGHAIVRALMQPWNYDENGCVDLLLINAGTVSLTLDGEWILTQQDYIVEFDLDISPPSS